jgi:hypothetical protein
MSKLGPHVIGNTGTALEWARRAPIVKALDTTEPLRVAPDGATRVFRHYFWSQDTSRNGADVARDVLAALGDYRHPRLFVELFNECSAGAYREQTRQIVEAAPVLHAAGVKLCGPSWSTGDYGETEWRYLVDSTRGSLDAEAVHCYWGNEGLTIWHALRFAQYWRPGDPPVLITECGRDRVEGGAAGWRISGVTPEQYLSELRAYDAALGSLDYVLGAVVFTAGPTSDWWAFDTDALDTDSFTLDSAPIPDTSAQSGGEAVTQAEMESAIRALQEQNRLLTEALRAIRQGKWSGADGVDGLIVAMQGGKPLGFTPSFPKA